LYTNRYALPDTVVVPPETFPPVVKPVVVPGTIHNICVPVTGGVIVDTAVLPEIIVMNVVGAIVAAAVTVGGNGCKLS
jgi:hypothetical protein